MSWRESILKLFVPEVARLTLVADPDGLLTEEVLLENIRARGFELIAFEDHAAFRFAYESKYRSRWDRGETTDLVVVLRSGAADLRNLPYDLLKAGRSLSFNLGEIFPNLSYPVVSALDRSDLDALFLAQKQYSPENLSDNATKDFALRHVFEIAPELIRSVPDLLRVLLRLHHQGRIIPAIFVQRLVQLLRQNEQFADWPLESLVSDRDTFFEFLQERWPLYLDRLTKQGPTSLHEQMQGSPMQYSGPADLPFDHDDVRVYVDTLFLEGRLKPVSFPRTESLKGQWATVGIRVDPDSDRLDRLRGLLQKLEQELPSEQARHREWLEYAQRWAELVALWYASPQANITALAPDFTRLQQAVDNQFSSWVHNRYSGLHNQPAQPPVMVHHIARVLASYATASESTKIALVVMDGLALDQWVTIRDVLPEQDPKLRLHESSVFAWIPTITPVSRQAVFAGRLPIYFPDSIYRTDADGNRWAQFWADQGIPPARVSYARGLGTDTDLEVLDEILSNQQVRIIGLVVDKVDKIMHGMELGTAGMHNQVRQWASQGFLTHLLSRLAENGFTVFMTADHGNVEAIGYGRPAEGVAADIRGERVRIYSNPTLRAQVKQRFADAMEWPPVGLPSDYLPLLAPDRLAFIEDGKLAVNHGSIALEELIVPFIRFEWRK